MDDKDRKPNRDDLHGMVHDLLTTKQRQTNRDLAYLIEALSQSMDESFRLLQASLDTALAKIERIETELALKTKARKPE